MIDVETFPSELAGFRDRHRGETLMVCGCGRSLALLPEGPDITTVGVNDVGRLFDPTYLVVLNPRDQFSDDRFRYVTASRACAVFSQLELHLDHAPLVRFQLGERRGVDYEDGETLPYTTTSIYVALCLAAFLGARRIGLLGVDFTPHHFFAQSGVHWLSLNLDRIDCELRRLGEALTERGVEVVNLSAASRLTAFAKEDLGDFLGSGS